MLRQEEYADSPKKLVIYFWGETWLIRDCGAAHTPHVVNEQEGCDWWSFVVFHISHVGSHQIFVDLSMICVFQGRYIPGRYGLCGL